MDCRQRRMPVLGKENNYENVNKKDGESLSKLDRLLMIKRANHQDKHQIRELRFLRNSKDVRGPSKSLHDKPLKQLKPLTVEPLTNTQQYCQLYGRGLVQESEKYPQTQVAFLAKHDIDKQLRARMLDWMVEVVSSYKFSAKTYFSSVALMDHYFAAEEHRLPITRLHIVGVVSMLVATKMDEVYPLKVKTVYDKIVHRKIEKKDLVQMQAKLVEKLNFQLNMFTFYDLALLKLHENINKNQQCLAELEKICQLLGKFVVFNYELYTHYDSWTLSEALIKGAIRVYGIDKIKNIFGQKFESVQSSKDCLICTDLIFQTAKTFRTTFKNLANVYKFTQQTYMQRLQQCLRHC